MVLPKITFSQLVEKIKQDQAFLKDTRFILVLDLGFDPDDIFALDYAIKHIKSSIALIVTSFYKTHEKALETLIHLYSQGIYDIPVAPGLAFADDDDENDAKFKKQVPLWPASFGYPHDSESLIGNHFKNYRVNIECSPEIMERMTRYAYDIYKNPAYTTNLVWKVLTDAKKNNKPIGILAQGPLTDVSSWIDSGYFKDGPDISISYVMSGVLFVKGQEYVMERLGYNYMMDPDSAANFFENMPGYIVIVNTDFCRNSSLVLSEDDRDDLMKILDSGDVDVKKAFAADIELFNEKKPCSVSLPLADCGVPYFAHQPEKMVEGVAAKFCRSGGCLLASNTSIFLAYDRDEHFLNANPYKYAQLHVEPSNIFFITRVENDETMKAEIMKTIIESAKNRGSFQEMVLPGIKKLMEKDGYNLDCPDFENQLRYTSIKPTRQIK
ncbi:hypothetical protein [Parasitella parasitica]|uniref:Inosine/uridine-preferring nucleoside hydrolase domain-containing protein n=1 Tax=Parasitella parasitica TaxID=35722 RepID=A0A0B7MXZ0_9FUNG|nr:hypothetical protein [Parasitella parasitica]